MKVWGTTYSSIEGKEREEMENEITNFERLNILNMLLSFVSIHFLEWDHVQ